MFEDMFMMPPSKLGEEVELMPLFSIGDDGDEDLTDESYSKTLPLLALRNTVLFPGIMIPITVGREKSLKAIKSAEALDNYVAVAAQKDIEDDNPLKKDLFDVGVVARIMKTIKMPDGTTTAIIQGRKVVNLGEMIQYEPFIMAEITERPFVDVSDQEHFDAVASSIRDLAQRIIELSPNIPTEATVVLKNIQSNDFLVHFIASNLNLPVVDKQRILEITDIVEKAEVVLRQVHKEMQLLQLKDKIESKVKVDIEKQQRDYYLNQQLKTIQEELGQNPQEEDFKVLEERAKKKKWNKDISEHFDKELKKIKRMNPAVAEYSVSLNYLEVMLDLPWNELSKDNFNLKRASKILDKEHFGLEKVKKRILEHLAVLKLKGDMKSPILCLVGPPGVGKTSLGKSIATALNREYVRMSLGGLHDESEIRGHRKTYIGAMPGRVIRSLKKGGSSNPVFILDEIDKIGKDFRGDPSSALLEVLDPEQNANFHDNYLDIEYDLSKVMFIATANSLSTIQPALLDRMEIIEVSGYSIEEKVEIAKAHLVPKQRKAHGIETEHVRLRKDVLEEIVQGYTKESGVRGLDRVIAKVMRFIAKSVAMEEAYNVQIKKSELKSILGPKPFDNDIFEETNTAGVAVGLAWTSVGGDILFIEANASKGKGKLTLTGNLGDVMKESATTALSFLKANAEQLNIEGKLFDEKDLHIHVPAGAIPKDGPSAGITMLSALTSILTNKPLRPYLAMTGEITLRGKVLPVGGIKEKVLAAKRAGIKEIILCNKNKKDILEIEEDYIKGLKFHYVKEMKDVLKLALTK